MMKFTTIEDLQSLIDNEIEESTELEYKSTFVKQKPNWKEELAKDVSAMANANGGVIVFGIAQKESNGHSIPEKLTPIPNTLMSKDCLSQLLSSNIQPVIENLEIIYIPFDKQTGFFVIEVPQGITAHQNRLSHLYHRRRNATIEPMEDYEIRDVMNRSKHPIIELEFELHKTIINVTEKPRKQFFNFADDVKEEDKQFTETKYKLKYRLVNKGMVYAKYINYFIFIPVEIVSENEKEYGSVDENNIYLVFSGNNTVRDITAVNGLNNEYGPARYNPILPGTKGEVKSVDLSFVDDVKDLPTLRIGYTIAADNAPIRQNTVSIADIKIVEKTKAITRDPNYIGFNPILLKN